MAGYEGPKAVTLSPSAFFKPDSHPPRRDLWPWPANSAPTPALGWFSLRRWEQPAPGLGELAPHKRRPLFGWAWRLHKPRAARCAPWRKPPKAKLAREQRRGPGRPCPLPGPPSPPGSILDCPGHCHSRVEGVFYRLLLAKGTGVQRG